MADGSTAAPAPAAAPAAAPAGDTAGGAPAPAPSSAKPQSKAAGTPAVGAGTRAADGRFLPKDGTQGVAKDDAAAEPVPGETKAEKEWRLKRNLKVYGKEEAIDYSEEDVVRELQKGRALQAKDRERQEATARNQRIYELAQNDPEAFLKAIGKDPEVWARQKLAQQAKLGAMTDDERALHEAKERLAHYEAKEKQQAEEQQKQQRTQKQQVLLEQNKKNFMAGLEKVGLPKSYETLYLMAETQKLAMDDGIEYTPEELARETEHRVDQYTERYLGNLDGKGLVKKLGPKRVQQILEASLAEFQASQDFGAAPKAAPVAPAKEPEEDGFVDEYEVTRRLKSIR